MKIVFNYNEHRISYYFWGEEEKKKKKKGITNLVGKTFMKNLHDIACDVDKQTICYFQRKKYRFRDNFERKWARKYDQDDSN